MLLIYSIILGIIQGITEFLPISSSGHLAVMSIFLKQPYQGLTFDVALHIGTLFALIVYFFKEWLLLIKHGLIAPKTTEGKLFWYIILATIPSVLIGFIFEQAAETTFRNPIIISAALIIGSLFLWIADKKAKSNKTIKDINIKDSLFIGAAQVLAIIAGISRSGITIAAGIFKGLKREEAAKFSFFLATPIIFGAGLIRLNKLNSSDIDAAFILGIASSFLTGLLSIKFLLRYLKKANLDVFIAYRILLALLIIVFTLTNIN